MNLIDEEQVPAGQALRSLYHLPQVFQAGVDGGQVVDSLPGGLGHQVR